MTSANKTYYSFYANDGKFILDINISDYVGWKKKHLEQIEKFPEDSIVQEYWYDEEEEYHSVEPIMLCDFLRKMDFIKK